jgi:hypothetical protein
MNHTKPKHTKTITNMNTSFILDVLENYIMALDWPYIFTLIILCYGFNHVAVRRRLFSTTGKKLRTRYRVLLVGLAYGMLVFFIRGGQAWQLEGLLQSFIFTLVFYQMIVQGFVYWLSRHGLPKDIARHILGEEDFQKYYPEQEQGHDAGSEK